MLNSRMNLLRWALIYFSISAVAGILQVTDVSVRTAELSTLLSVAFLIPFIAFVVFELLALGSPESDSNTPPDGIRTVFGQP